MIIQCQECRTKFRFDEGLIDGEGVWVRCSRCRHVFFQANPVTEKPIVAYATIAQGRFASAADIQAERGLDRDDREPLLDDSMDLMHRESADEDAVLTNVAIFREVLEETRAGAEDLDELPADARSWQGESQDDGEESPGEIERRARRMPWKLLAWMTVLVLLVVGLYLWFFPGAGQQAWQELSSLAVFEQIWPKAKPVQVGPAQVMLQDVRQRFVGNGLLGDIRIVEGMAVNQSKYPLTRISIRGELYDAGAAVIRERLTYCGNLLSDQELATLTEEQMQQELSIPQGSDISNDRIEPSGQIPFMVVFANEPRGVVKTTVVPAGAERLLQ
jgi:predicted Zn finger-like uncharacterized protein